MARIYSIHVQPAAQHYSHNSHLVMSSAAFQQVSAIVMIEHILQQLAQALGHNPDSFRTSLMIKLPDEVVKAAKAAEEAAGSAATVSRDSTAACPEDRAGSCLPHPKHHPAGPPLSTTTGKPIELFNYTLPYMWQQLQAASGYSERRAAVGAFNKANRLRKMGLALVPIR